MSRRTLCECDWCGYEEDSEADPATIRETRWEFCASVGLIKENPDLCEDCREHLAGVIDAARNTRKEIRKLQAGK